MRRVAVIGSGTWGTAASGLVAPHAQQVVLWARRPEVSQAIRVRHRNPAHLPRYPLPGNVTSTSDLVEAARGADAIVLAVPSSFLRPTCKELSAATGAGTPVLVLTKGIECDTGLLMADVVAAELGSPERIAVLSGPNHAEEIAAGKVSAAVIASANPEMSSLFQALFVSPSFRAYESADLIGVEVCGAIKNVVAIACGIAAGLDAGDNTLAVLMTRGLAEVGRFVSSLGGDPFTCMGLAGMGDLVATCTSPFSRNRAFGEAFARGMRLEEYESSTHMVVEGARAAVSAHRLAAQRGIEAPVSHAVHALLHEGASLADAIGSLLDRIPHTEFYGFA